MSRVCKSFDITFDRDLMCVKVSKDLMRGEAAFDTIQSHISKAHSPLIKIKDGLCRNQSYIKSLVKKAFATLKGHCHEQNFKNSTAQKHVHTVGNILTVVKFSYNYYTSVLKLNIE